MRYMLHAAPGSCSLAPHIILEEIGEPYELALMSPGHPETKTEEFRRLNPKGRVPVLTAEDFILTEAPAILVHLGLEYPNARLLSIEGDGLARSIEWCNWLSGTVHQVAVRMIWLTGDFTDDAGGHVALIAKGNEHLRSAFSFIESKLKAREWAVGDRYSVVDPYLLVFFRWGNRMHIDMRDSYPAWTEHAHRIEKRKAVQSVLAREGISLWR